MLLELIEGSFLGGDDCGCHGSACRKEDPSCTCKGESTGMYCTGNDICGCLGGFIIPLP